MAYLMVGSAATIRAGLVISPVFLSWGTLKSTRMRTRLPLRSTSLMLSLLERDILEELLLAPDEQRAERFE